MIDKPYGKYTLDQLKKFVELLHESRNIAPELEKIFHETDPKRLKAILGESLSWSHFYEMPFNKHISSGLLVLDWKDDFKKAVQSEDPQQYIFDFFEQLDFDKEWNGGHQGKFKMHHLVEIVISFFRTMKSIMVYQKSLSTLIEEVTQGRDKSLFDAVRIDRTIVGCSAVKYRISMAEMTNDKKFFRHLNNALKGSSKKHWVGQEELRYMMQALVETGADQLNGKNLEQLFVEHLQLYPKAPTAQKNLYERFLATKNNHLK